MQNPHRGEREGGAEDTRSFNGNSRELLRNRWLFCFAGIARVMRYVQALARVSLSVQLCES